MLTYLQRIEWFIGLVLLQVLVLNHMHINGYATPFFFIYFIVIEKFVYVSDIIFKIVFFQETIIYFFSFDYYLLSVFT